MPFKDPWLHRGQSSPIEYCRRLYEQTGNPIHLCRALQICRQVGDRRDGSATFPAWIVDYLVNGFTAWVQDRCSRGEDERDADFAASLAAVLGFKRRGQGAQYTAFASWDRSFRDQALVSQILRSRRARPGVSTTAIIADLADQLEVSEATVWRAWRAWRHVIKDPSKADEQAHPASRQGVKRRFR